MEGENPNADLSERIDRAFISGLKRIFESQERAHETAAEILCAKEIPANSPALLITAEEAIAGIIECLEDLKLEVDLENLTRSQLEKLISDYGACVVEYHPENYHQARGALLRNLDALKECGLQDEDEAVIDF